MKTLHEQVREKIAEWWTTHPDFRERYSKIVSDADSLARSVVHWHHNVESARRHAPEKTNGEQFFLRQYAVIATQAWLISAQTELETYPADHSHWRGYGHRDQECLIRCLQVALDDFEYNDRGDLTRVAPL